MITIGLNELKRLQMEILHDVDDVCRKNGLRYSLCGGTLLGAVRHKGYIPWDDDIDIFMLRPEYERLIQIINSDTDSKFDAVTCFTHQNYSKPFAKIQNKETVILENYDRRSECFGVNIDLFPVDGLPAQWKARKKYWRKMRILKRFNSMIYQKHDEKAFKPKRLLRLVMFNIFKLFPANFLSKKLNRIAAAHPVDESDRVAVSVFGYGENEEMPSAVFDEIVEYPFEGKKFCGIKDYDAYLGSVYGDYMRLPSANERISKHPQQIFYKETAEAAQ